MRRPGGRLGLGQHTCSYKTTSTGLLSVNLPRNRTYVGFTFTVYNYNALRELLTVNLVLIVIPCDREVIHCVSFQTTSCKQVHHSVYECPYKSCPCNHVDWQANRQVSNYIPGFFGSQQLMQTTSSVGNLTPNSNLQEASQLIHFEMKP